MASRIPSRVDVGGDVGGPKGAFGPAWSHDGRLAFVSLLDLGNVGLYDVDLRVARSDGSRPVVVSRIPGQICSAGGPSWAPEGKRLVWSVEPCDAQYPTLRVVTVSTGAMRTVGFGRDPDWRKANG